MLDNGLLSGEFKEKPWLQQIRQRLLSATILKVASFVCTVFCIALVLVTVVVRSADPPGHADIIAALNKRGTIKDIKQLGTSLWKTTPTWKSSKPDAIVDTHDDDDYSDDAEESEEVSVLDQERRGLVKWLRHGASLEEVRYLEFVKDWLSRATRPEVVRKMEALQNGEMWNNCANDGEICQCLSGILRYGSPDHDLWVNMDRTKQGGEVQVKCSTDNFGQDPKKGSSKLCQCKGVTCPDGTLADLRRCKEGQRSCPLACGRDWRPNKASPPSVNDLCKGRHTHELLFSCNRAQSLLPSKSHRHNEMQEVLYESGAEFCNDKRLAPQLDTYLDCNYVSQFKKYVDQSSGWFEEAYVTYVGGPKDSKHEHRATNLIRSVQAFSTRPLVLFVVDDVFEPPVFWRDFPCLIVYKMDASLEGMPFNINKVRTMITVRTVTGAELDGDSTLFAGMDNMFAPTRREVTPEYPFPIMPVHWGAQEEKFELYKGARSMRWCHAHPTWTYWALPFYFDLLLQRLAPMIGGKDIKLWKLTARTGTRADIDMKELLRQGEAGRQQKKAKVEDWMVSDEPMLNVLLWQAGATKAWCKYDLEPALYMQGDGMKASTHADPKWYPEGLPLIFYSLHNTKHDKETDHLLTLLIFCSKHRRRSRTSCMDTSGKQLANCKLPKVDMLERRSLRMSNPVEYLDKMCCCLEPRREKPFFWAGKWYKTAAEVPERAGLRKANRTCLLP